MPLEGIGICVCVQLKKGRRRVTMSETKAKYKTDRDEVNEAMEMLGNGYELPSVEIHRPETVILRRGQRLVEEVVPAFVKISTDFKKELYAIDGNALKVWVYIALSINRTTEQAHPGLRTIAEGCGIDKDTVFRAVKRLEELGLLTVDRDKKKYNVYEIPEYVSANARKDIVPIMGTDGESVPIEAKSVPIKGESVPISWGLNQRNQIKPDTQKKSLKGTGLAFTEINQKHLEEQKKKERMMERIEKTLHVRPSMGNPKWETVIKKLIKFEASGQTIEKYGTWATANRFDAPKIGQIANNPYLILSTWPAAFLENSSSDPYRNLKTTAQLEAEGKL
jgi:DNA-binding Lrp family transcriptional regulator